MRVYQFITLFLAIGIVCGCSHRRRAHQQPVARTATLCDCAACRHEQERLISTGAVPAEHFGNPVSTTTLPASNSASVAPTQAVPIDVAPPGAASVTSEQSELSPEYTPDSKDAVVNESPFSSGNPIEINEAPGLFNVPVVDEIESHPNQIPSDTLKLTPEPSGITPLGQRPAQDSSENVFQPFSRDLFKAKSKTNAPLPPEQQPSILIDKVSEASQPDLGAVTPSPTSEFQLSLSELSSSDLEIPDSVISAPAGIEPKLPEAVEPEIDTREPRASNFERVSNVATPDFASNNRTFVPKAARPTETVVEGQLYEDPVVLYARTRRGQRTPNSFQTAQSVQPVSAQKPVQQHQSITQNSQLDPVYGLPLNNQVQFDSLPAFVEPQPAPAPAEAQHLHVHIHHEYGNNAGVVQGPIAYQNGQPVNAQVVFRDDKGRVIVAPPTPTAGVTATVPTGDQRTYYIPPKQILRLKAVSPLDQPRSNPSVASIQMRDTVVYGGTHLLTKPEYQAQVVQTNHGLPGIDHEKLRGAFKTSPKDSSLR